MRNIILITFLTAFLFSCAADLHREQGRAETPAPLKAAGESRNGIVEGSAGSPAVRGVEPSAACLGCHDYKENHHPIDIVPANAANYSFPLYDGRIRCLTCHTGNHAEGPYMLRGENYKDRRDICFRCHYEEDYRQIYPHIMLESNGKFREVNGKPVCLICHLKTPDPRVDRTNDVVFRADVAFLCWRCHSLMGAAVLNHHILLKPSPDMIRHIKRNEERLSVTIPLVPRDRITCSTCHNPHQKGVIIYESSAKGADSPDRLRIADPAICLLCHQM